MTLLGQTVNAYGHDLEEQTDLADLLAAVDAILVSIGCAS